jgi:hypothetical protein
MYPYGCPDVINFNPFTIYIRILIDILKSPYYIKMLSYINVANETGALSAIGPAHISKSL